MQPTARFVTAIQILALLAQSRTLKTSEQLGPGGGSKIARPPHTINFLGIYRALEERRPLRLPVSARSSARQVNDVLLTIHDRSQRSLEAALSQVTLASVLGRS